MFKVKPWSRDFFPPPSLFWGFWRFYVAECFELSSDSLAASEESAPTRLISRGRHLCYPPNFFCLAPPPGSEATDHFKEEKKGKGHE